MAVERHAAPQDALQEIVPLLRPEAKDVLYATGSVFDGFGNPRSDLDLYLITADVARAAERARGEVARIRGPDRGVIIVQPERGPRLDIEIYGAVLVDALAVKLKQRGDAMASLEAAHGVDWFELDFLHRLKIAIPIWNNEGLEALRARFNFNELRTLLAGRRLADSEGSVEDALGALEGGQLQTAFLCAREAVEMAFDAYLASQGETYMAAKWKFEKARRALGPDHEWVRALWDLESSVPARVEDIHAWVGSALLLAQKLSFAASEATA